MIETADLILDKARYCDWKDMYENVWSREEAARYMYWRVTESEEDARRRAERSVAFQKDHDAFFIYEKSSGRAIGFAGIKNIRPGVCEESGICLGPDYTGKGYGKQVLQALIDLSREKYQVTSFIYKARQENAVSRHLAESNGFSEYDREEAYDERYDQTYTLICYEKKLS
ncbi:MAG: GNAT family N-acetyltransferase [Erysipelotrichaceae bacterium]|nr:GNAT family N-acetyltransferase [Erysipelotrichaceae bacterium]